MTPAQLERRRNILRLRSHGLTLDAIASMYGISRQRVWDLARKAARDERNAGYIACLKENSPLVTKA